MTASHEAPLERAAIVQLMAGLARVPSEIGPRLEAEPAVTAFIRDEVAPRLVSYGLAEHAFDASGSFVARGGAGKGGGRLLLVMNAMTQAAYDMPDPFVPRIVSGESYGIAGEVMVARGMSEQRANMSAMLSGVAAALSAGNELEGELIVLCCPSGETGRHDAIAAALDAFDIHADMAVLGGTSLTISLGNRGRVDLELDVRGETSHSSRPHQGANAALAACSIVSRLIEAGNRDLPHSVVGSAALTVTGVTSYPQTSHTVQDRCIVKLDRRLAAGEDPHEAVAALRRILKADEPYRDPFSGKALSVELKVGPYMYPSLVDEAAPVVEAIRLAARASVGEDIETVFLDNAFDQGYLNHIGIPTVNFGCGEYKFAHTHDDLASIDRTVKAARIFCQLIRDVAGRKNRLDE